jgi:hypothetical protein
MGVMGQSPFAGVAWQELHYLEGLRRLGYDVYYVEDTGEWPYNPEQNAVTAATHYTVAYLDRIMRWCGLSDRWAYRSVSEGNRIHGMSEESFVRLLGEVELLINLTGSTVLREEHLKVPIRIYLETDPVLPQLEIALGQTRTVELLSAHTHHFSFGENFGSSDCGVPLSLFDYKPTRQPVVLEWWASAFDTSATQSHYTTVATWRQDGKDIEWQSETYAWSKHLEFRKFMDLPRKAGEKLEVALAGPYVDQARSELTPHGWRVIDAVALSTEILPYRDYIFASKGEFTVAKDQNVRLRSGWFSDRSACYLAAGKPVVTQDTGFGNILPTGQGLFAFQALDDVLNAFEQIESDYEKHSRAATEIAEGYFNSDLVLTDLLQRAGA